MTVQFRIKLELQLIVIRGIRNLEFKNFEFKESELIVIPKISEFSEFWWFCLIPRTPASRPAE